ncbi:MAG TPA: hypothetical protein VL327_07645 [Pyrinomonadaceae bacterium]|jgi:hypothetical protein|nr:hypothetical protein [Pyrinomonadaceae bacterium]
MNSFISVPFKTESGLSQVNGVGKFSSAGVVLEFESKLFGILPGGVKEARIPLAEILDVKFKKGVLKRGAKIELRMRTFGKLSQLPYKDGKLTLKLERDDYERGEEAVARLQKDMAEQQESEPPPHTPVSRLFDESEDEETKKL